MPSGVPPLSVSALSAPVEVVGAVTTRVHAGAPSPFTLDIPGDPSSAAFFVVAATLVPGSELVIEDVLANPGRLAYLDVLRAMGASITVTPKPDRGGEPVADLTVAHAALRGTTIRSQEAIVDELPVLAVAAAFASGVTEIREDGHVTMVWDADAATFQPTSTNAVYVYRRRSDTPCTASR